MKRVNPIVAGYRRTCRSIQTGGMLLAGTQTHWSRAKPGAKRERQRFNRDRNRGFSD